jgi:hypothetical protein
VFNRKCLNNEISFDLSSQWSEASYMDGPSVKHQHHRPYSKLLASRDPLTHSLKHIITGDWCERLERRTMFRTPDSHGLQHLSPFASAFGQSRLSYNGCQAPPMRSGNAATAPRKQRLSLHAKSVTHAPPYKHRHFNGEKMHKAEPHGFEVS